jgi:hypothetical protein
MSRLLPRVIIIVLVIIAAPILAIWLYMHSQKLTIINKINENSDRIVTLAELALENNDTDTYRPDWTKGGFIDNGVVFYQKSFYGFVPTGKEYGYYYAADGKMHVYPGMDNYVTETDEKGITLTNPDGSDGCYIQSITENLYYYETWSR